MKDRGKFFVRRVWMSALGVALTGVGVGILQAINLGVDPYTSFVSGFMNLLGFRFSVVYWIVTGVLLLETFIFQKKLIHVATILNFVILGPIAEVVNSVLGGMVGNGSLIIRLLFLGIGLVILGFSAALYYTANIGVSGYDSQAIMLHRLVVKRGPFRYCRITTDAICIAVGFTLHANIGIATIISAFFMGPLVDLFTETVANPLLEINKTTTA